MTGPPPAAPRSSLFYVWRVIAFRPRLFALCVFLIAFTYLMPLLPPLIVGAIVDSLSGQAQVGLNVATLVAALIVYAFIDAGAHVWQQVSEARQTVHGSLLMQQNIFERLLHRKDAVTLPISNGSALNRFRNDVNEVSETALYSADPIGQLLTGGIAFVVLFVISPVVCVAVVVPLCVLLALVHVLGSRIKRFRWRRQLSTDRATNLVNEAFTASGTIKAAGAEDRVADELAVLNEERRQATLNDVALTQALDSVSRNLPVVASGVILLFLASQMSQGEFTVGDFIVFSTYMSFISELIANAGDLMTRFRQTSVSTERLLELLPDQEPEALVEDVPLHLTGALPPGAPTLRERSPDDPLRTLELRDLTYTYPSSDRGIQGVELALEAGSLTVVTGRVGSGKTTLLRSLLGLLPATGQVVWNGRVVEDEAAEMVPPRTAYAPQSPVLLSDTLRANIALGLELDPHAVERALHAAVLDDDIAELDQGVGTLVGPRGIRLSGGQVQRTAAARMFVRAPDLLVVDDVSSALDVVTERELWSRLIDERQGCTTLVVSHRRQALERATQIVLLDEGRVVDTGTLRELLDRSSLMQEIWSGRSETGEPV